MPEQARLFDAAPVEWTPETLVVSDSNAAAWRSLNRWKEWPCGALALIGPTGGGKTHMAAAWRALIERETGRTVQPLVVDNADRFGDDAQLSLILDEVRGRGGPAVLVGCGLPRDWPCALPDLHSRLAALPVAKLNEPDEALLARVLERLCKARFMKLEADAAVFIAQRIDRSYRAAHDVVVRLEALHAVASRPISVRIAARTLRNERCVTSADLFSTLDAAPEAAEES
jgi:chromosomal replication initiation ATPase DnaA